MNNDVEGSTVKGTLLIHKEEKALFAPWYGFSHGNELNHDIVAYFCKFLLFEHLETNGKLCMNLMKKSELVQLVDLQIHDHMDDWVDAVLANKIIGKQKQKNVSDETELNRRPQDSLLTTVPCSTS